MLSANAAIRSRSLSAAPRPGLRARAALLVHQLLEALLVDAHVLLGRQLERELQREAVGVVQQERLVGADALLARVLGARDHVVEQPHALLERAAELLLLAREPHPDRVLVLVQLGVGGRHQLLHDVSVADEEAGLDAEPPPLDDGAAHQAPQHVAAVLVRRDDAVGDEEAHAARVVGEDPHRAVDLEGLAVALAAELLAEVDERADLVGLEHRRRALHDRRQAVEAEPRVDVVRRQRGERVDRVLVVLHEHEVPVLQEALVLAARQVVLLAELEPAVEVELAARARTGRSGPPARSSRCAAAGRSARAGRRCPARPRSPPRPGRGRAPRRPRRRSPRSSRVRIRSPRSRAPRRTPRRPA